MAKSPWNDQIPGTAAPEGPATDAKTISKSDTVNLPNGACRGIYVGGAGDIVVTTVGGTKLTFTGVVAGSILPVMATRVWSTNTTATNMVALY